MNFSIEEYTYSQTAERRGIDNSIPDDLIENAEKHILTLEEVRTACDNRPVNIGSGYRCLELNTRLKGSLTSDHMKALASDITSRRFGNPKEVCLRILEAGIKFDQLIYEGSWCHISTAPKMRQMIMTASFTSQGVIYSEGIIT